MAYSSKILSSSEAYLAKELKLPSGILKQGSTKAAKVDKHHVTNHLPYDNLDLSSRISSHFGIGNGVDPEKLRDLTKDYLEQSQRSNSSSIARQTAVIQQLQPLANQHFEKNGIAKLTNQIENIKINLPKLNNVEQLTQIVRPIAKQLQDSLLTLKTVHHTVAQSLSTEIDTANQKLSQLHINNQQISLASTASERQDLIKQRKLTLKELNQQIDFQIEYDSKHNLIIKTQDGFSLLNSNGPKVLELQKADIKENEQNFANEIPRHRIIYDFSLGQGHGQINLSDRLASSSGSIAGLLGLQGIINGNGQIQSYGLLGEVAAHLSNLSTALQTITANNFNSAEQLDPIAKNQFKKQLFEEPIKNNHQDIYQLQASFSEHVKSLERLVTENINSAQLSQRIALANQAITKIRKETIQEQQITANINSNRNLQDSYQAAEILLNNSVTLFNQVQQSL